MAAKKPGGNKPTVIGGGEPGRNIPKPRDVKPPKTSKKKK